MDEEYARIILQDPQGIEYAYLPVITFAIDDKEYIVLQRDAEDSADDLALFRFHAGPDDEMILDDIEDPEEYEDAARQAEVLINGEAETDEFLISEEDGEYQAPDYEEDEDYCYEDAEGRLFIYGKNGEVVYLNEYGEPVAE